ncbi:IPExxxVDY family protein [Sungkyunkwania multivorans]|uniref:IPExxxVDY family protein n=1 Tax=Sungkyunkwania multivorans TaxID=1173618 RepID=A0ABW3D1S9_9FLAO
MGVQHLVIDDFEEEDFLLIAIHCSLPAYQIAFLLNRHLNMRFKRTDMDLRLYKQDAQYQLYLWHDDFEDVDWSLVANSCRQRQETHEAATLFETTNTNETINYLIPEEKKIDYFIKVNGQTKNFESVLAQIRHIPQIITAYTIEMNQLKSKNHLIF